MMERVFFHFARSHSRTFGRVRSRMQAYLVHGWVCLVLSGRMARATRLVAIALLAVASEGRDCRAQNEGAANPAGRAREAQAAMLLQASTLRGMPVVDLVGAPLGKLDDLLVEVESSRVAAILVRPGDAADENANENAGAVKAKVVPATLVNYHSAAANRAATLQVTIPGASDPWRDAPTWPPVDATGAPLADRLAWLDDAYKHFGRAWQRPCVDRWWGWGPGSDYNALFTPERNVELRGTVLGVTAAWPVCVSSPGVRLYVEVDGLVWGIDLGPIWYVVDQGFQFEPGKAIEVRGTEALLAPERLVLAVEVSYAGRTLRLRGDNGAPAWGAAPPVATLKLLSEMGATTNADGQALGRVVDLAIEPAGWCVAYAALGAADDAQSLTAVPASLLTADAAGDGLRGMMGASPADAASAEAPPRIDANQWAVALDMALARRVAAHYGVPFCGQPACTHVATDFASRGMYGHALGRVVAIEPCAVPAGAPPPARWTLKLLTASGPSWVTFDAEPVRRTDLEIGIGDVVSAWGWPDATRRWELQAGILEAGGRYLRVRDAAP